MTEPRRCAVVHHPLRTPRSLRPLLDRAAVRHGWASPTWFTTTRTDPGEAVTRQALASGVDLVICIGGDGTVRAVASALAHSGVPLAIVPTGTANLVARNLRLPRRLRAAVEVAFTGAATPFDLLEVATDEQTTHAVAMAGLGIDGRVMATTSTRLKSRVGSLAYAHAILSSLGHRRFAVQIELDDHPDAHRDATLALVGNVARMQAGLQLFPRARPDDAELDLLVTAPRGLAGWVGWGLGLVVGRAPGTTRHRGRRLVLTTDTPQPWQVDGDTFGVTQRLTASVVPGAVLVVGRT